MIRTVVPVVFLALLLSLGSLACVTSCSAQPCHEDSSVPPCHQDQQKPTCQYALPVADVATVMAAAPEQLIAAGTVPGMTAVGLSVWPAVPDIRWTPHRLADFSSIHILRI